MIPSVRHASTTPPPKPRVLAQPDKFRPPSHPSRLRSKTPRYQYGPELTQEQKTKKQYPHMMPPEGSFMHWFLTNRTIHLWISLSILVSLVFGVWLSEFIHNTPYRDLLPPNSMFLSHPFSFIGRWAEVYNMHVAYVSSQTAERRKQKVDDVKKRSDYRKAHGLETAEGVFGGWTAKTEEETRGPGFRYGEQVESGAVMEIAKGTGESVMTQAGEADETYVDFEGKTQPLRKKWFGLW
ncbi:hypothetical protein DOTSEDRAFT_165466 [Dothistroma septosporum NZE10]|uniref:Uncharacterized protein n=1 Tax=Dothistroma septosporum (strain NZE10 / CBS 128990) TaxID=675120 RepID=N1Q3Q9_DOTSN|nr:hypothetical protein DOTSEDRAFT_165466 [Dothistroma septosporum NZE10]